MSEPERAYGEPLTVLQRDVGRIADSLARLVPAEGTRLSPPAAHLTDSGGKLLRPLVTLASGYAAGGARSAETVDRCIRAAVAVEALHVGTLCHDDVMDEADIRRGRPSVNVRWGNCTAILSGDVLIARAISTVAGLGAVETRLLARTLEDLCEGQALETAALFDVTRDRQAYLAAVELKSASLFAVSCQLGALCAGLDEGAAAGFADFGRSLGIAFQIVDDVLDLVSTAEALGKPPGSDLREGVVTLPLIEALERAPQLRSVLGRPLSAAEADRARAVVLSCGAIEAALAAAAVHLGRARERLAGVPVADPRYVTALLGLAESILDSGVTGLHTAAPDPLGRRAGAPPGSPALDGRPAVPHGRPTGVPTRPSGGRP
jgi:geranylgeranyl pyrophosphate synthase